MQNRNKIMFFGFFMLFLISGLIINAGLVNSAVGMTINSVATLALGLFLFKDHLKQEWGRLKSQTTLSKIIWLSLGLFILNIVVRAGLLMILEPFLNLDTLGMNQQDLEAMQTQIHPLLFIFFTSISAPIVEELVFRQSLNGWVPRNNKQLILIMWVVSTLIFAGAHVYTLQDFIIYLPLAISLLWMYVKYDRNVWASIIFHFINNTIAVIMMYLVQLVPQEMLQEAAGTIIQLIRSSFN